MTLRPAAAALLLLPLAACGGGERQAPAETTAGDDGATGATAGATAAGGVERQVIEPSPTPAPPPAQAVIATQPGPGGSQVALNRVAVTGDVMTVQLTYAGGNTTDFYDVDEVSVIDDATAQRIGVLKDNAGKPLAAPVSSSGERMNVNTRDAQIVWFKFPAPPASSPTVSINIPNVAPFDGVPVTR